MGRFVIWTAAVLIAVGLLMGTYMITSAIMSPEEPPAQTTKQEETKKETPPTGVGPSVLGLVVVFLLLFGTLVVVTTGAWRGAGPEWRHTMAQPVFIAIVGVLVLNALTYLFAYPYWRWFADHSTLFWGTNISIVLFAHFITRPDRYAKYIAYGIALLVLVGFVSTIYKPGENDPANRDESRTSVVSRIVNDFSYGVPAAVALEIIADHESGNGTPGSGKQFDADHKPVRGKENPLAVGKWQINLADSATKEEVKQWDVETEAGNRAAAEFLYKKYGTRPWNATKSGWEPKLRAYTWGRGEAVALIIKAPKDEWSEIIPLPRNGGRHSVDGYGQKFTVRWNNGRPDQTDEDLPRPDGVAKKKPLVVYDFRLQSREAEVALITVKFF